MLLNTRKMKSNDVSSNAPHLFFPSGCALRRAGIIRGFAADYDPLRGSKLFFAPQGAARSPTERKEERSVGDVV